MGLGQAERQIAVKQPREFAASLIGIHTPNPCKSKNGREQKRTDYRFSSTFK
jgi:hypothetical protein